MAELKKRISIITATYPYGKTEGFLHNEVIFLSGFFDIEIFPTTKGNINDTPRELPNNVTFNKPFLSKKKHIRLFEGFFNLSPLIPYLKDLILLFKESKNIKKSLLQWLLHLTEFRTIFSSKKFKNILLTNDIIYFYWCNFPINFIDSYTNSYFVRIHGGEVDIERNNNYIPMLAYKIIVNNSICYLPISYKAKSYIKAFGDIKFEISRLGVEIRKVEKSINEENSPIVIVSCSNLIPLKRVHLIIDALRFIDGLKIEWYHFGDGVLKGKLLKLTRKLLKSNVKVEFLGQVKNERILEFYKRNSVDLFINVSEFEGVPVSIMEAMSFGILCFATNVGAVSELVSSDTGILVPVDFDIALLSEAIVNSRDLKMNVKKSLGKKKCKELYNASHNYKKLTNLMLAAK